MNKTKHELQLSPYDKYVLTDELSIRITQLQATRDKVGISPTDKEAEPNRHIASLLSIANQLGLNLSVNVTPDMSEDRKRRKEDTRNHL